jgi:hypothetical protein
MPIPTLDQIPATPTSPATRPRRRPSALAIGVLVVLATGIGASVALVNRPTPSTPAAQGAVASPTTVAPSAPASSVAQQPGQASKPPGPAAGAGTEQPPLLSDGRHHAFVRKVDTRHRTFVVDVVQLLHDQAAVDAAIQDGKSPEAAQYLVDYVRNQSRRLRTLPYAGDLRVNLLDSCEETTPRSQQVLLSELAKNASLDDVFYYTLTVRHGVVRQIDEHLVNPAC